MPIPNSRAEYLHPNTVLGMFLFSSMSCILMKYMSLIDNFVSCQIGLTPVFLCSNNSTFKFTMKGAGKGSVSRTGGCMYHITRGVMAHFSFLRSVPARCSEVTSVHLNTRNLPFGRNCEEFLT